MPRSIPCWFQNLLLQLYTAFLYGWCNLQKQSESMELFKRFASSANYIYSKRKTWTPKSHINHLDFSNKWKTEGLFPLVLVIAHYLHPETSEGLIFIFLTRPLSGTFTAPKRPIHLLRKKSLQHHSSQSLHSTKWESQTGTGPGPGSGSWMCWRPVPARPPLSSILG